MTAEARLLFIICDQKQISRGASLQLGRKSAWRGTAKRFAISNNLDWLRSMCGGSVIKKTEAWPRNSTS